jgi:biopolymer transport protein ExbD
MRLATGQKLQTNFGFSSLTSLVMLLLTFVLLCVPFVMQTGIAIRLPRTETGDSGSDKTVTVRLTSRGQIFVNAHQVTLETLGPELVAAMKGDPQKVVVVNADRDVTLQNTVRVIDVAKGVGATRFLVATLPMSAQ